MQKKIGEKAKDDLRKVKEKAREKAASLKVKDLAMVKEKAATLKGSLKVAFRSKGKKSGTSPKDDGNGNAEHDSDASPTSTNARRGFVAAVGNGASEELTAAGQEPAGLLEAVYAVYMTRQVAVARLRSSISVVLAEGYAHRKAEDLVAVGVQYKIWLTYCVCLPS